MKSKSQKKYDYWYRSAMKNAWFAPTGEVKMLGVSFVYGQLWCFQENQQQVIFLGVISIADRMDAIMAAHYIHTHAKKSYREGLSALHRIADAAQSRMLYKLQIKPIREP